jgi:hypothetical protein
MATTFVLFLILVLLVVPLKIIYPHNALLNNVEYLVGRLALIERSEMLLWFTDCHDIQTLRGSGLSTKLGRLKDKDGEVR